MPMIKTWFLETRPQFLILSVILVVYGSSIAFYQGYFNLTYFFIALVGLVALHIAVNTFNDYYDYKSGIDLNTTRTPFSGGSGILPQGILSPTEVFYFAILNFLIGLSVGVYFIIIRGISLLPIVILGGIFVYFYTTHLAKLMLGEISAGLGLGVLPVIGSYFVQTGFYSMQALVASIPAGILTFNLLFLNEFPDYNADKRAGRKNFVILLGKKIAARLYSAISIFNYIFIGMSIIAGYLPYTALLAFLTLPEAIKAIKGATINYDNIVKLIPSLGSNVKTVLGTQFLLAISFIIARFLGI